MKRAFFLRPWREDSRLQAERIITALQKKYEALESLQASFEQKNELKSLGRTTTSSGSLLLKKPGKLRMEYLKPENQVLVSDGRTLWIYTARFNQVMISETGRLGFSATPLLFLAGKGNLNENFHVLVEEVGIARRSGGIWRAGQPHRIRLEPKSKGASYRRMWIEVEPENFTILTLAYIDNVGNKSHLRFSDVTGRRQNYRREVSVCRAAECGSSPNAGPQRPAINKDLFENGDANHKLGDGFGADDFLGRAGLGFTHFHP